MNKAILIGRLTKTPEYRTMQSGGGICTFTLAVNRKTKDAEGKYQCDFLPVVAFKNLAEICQKYLDKGREAAVSGSIQTRKYQRDGKDVYVTEIVADDVQFIGAKTETKAVTSGRFTDASNDVLPF